VLCTGVVHCEYQNEPKRGKETVFTLERETVLQRLNGLPQYQIPENAHFITVMCDINQIGIHFCAVAFDNNMSASIIHYGKYPAENNVYLWRADDTKGLSEAQAIYKGILEVSKLFSTPRFSKADRKPLKQNIILIDCGYMTDTVFLAVNSLKNQMNISCSRGRASKAYRQSKTIGRPGDNWHITEWPGKGRVLIHNSDYWRAHAQQAFLLPSGAPGSCSLYGADPRPHLKIASHITAERLEELVHGDTCDFYNWSRIPGESNDLLDCLVGCFVGASGLGLNISGGEQSWRQRKAIPRETRKPKVPMSEE
jgi:hypothetical protein